MRKDPAQKKALPILPVAATVVPSRNGTRPSPSRRWSHRGGLAGLEGGAEAHGEVAAVEVTRPVECTR